MRGYISILLAQPRSCKTLLCGAKQTELQAYSSKAKSEIADPLDEDELWEGTLGCSLFSCCMCDMGS